MDSGIAQCTEIVDHSFGDTDSRMTRVLDLLTAALDSDTQSAKLLIARAASLIQNRADRPAAGKSITSGAGGLTRWQASRIRQYVSEHLTESLAVSDLSAVVDLSVAYFSRAFKRTFRQSPYAYVVHQRIELALKIMLNGNTPLSEVAQTCGFSDQPHFSRTFRRIVGQSPAAWRRQSPGRNTFPGSTRADYSSMRTIGLNDQSFD
jgi:AraC family transcriptional regulator